MVKKSKINIKILFYYNFINIYKKIKLNRMNK